MPVRIPNKSKKGKRSTRPPVRRGLEQIQLIDLASTRIQLELLDMFVEVSTPEVSEDENDPPQLPQLPEETRSVGAAELQRAEYLRSLFLPTDPSVPYYPLYMIPKYRQSCRRKFLRLRRYARHCNFPYIFYQRRFWRDTVRIRDQYGHVGGRDKLNGLLAIYHYCNNETDSDESDLTETDSESDPESNQDPPSKKPKPDPDFDHDPPPPPVPILV